MREGSLHFTQTAQVLRLTQDDKEFTTGADDLVFVVLIRLIHGEPAEFVGDLEKMLVAFVPLGAHFAQEHRTLVGPAQLQVSHFADVCALAAGTRRQSQ